MRRIYCVVRGGVLVWMGCRCCCALLLFLHLSFGCLSVLCSALDRVGGGCWASPDGGSGPVLVAANKNWVDQAVSINLSLLSRVFSLCVSVWFLVIV